VDLPRVRSWIDRFTQSQGISLSPEQQQAVEMSATQRVMILTGGPGCGKTFCTRTIVALWKAMGKKIALAAPTGRAAQRLSEMAGIEAKTIHRLLEFDPATRGFKRGVEEPLPRDAIVVDEASMLDLFLANSLIKAIRTDAHLLIVGDIDQLPSVGPGSVLGDLIKSGRIPVVKLTQVFRQAQSSGIIRAAHQINRGGDILRVGDRVIQLKNDYEREVFNGDLGVVNAIDSTEHEVTIQFDGRAVIYDYADLNELGLAWSISIHKSQGSEYPVVILPLYMQHYLLLSRNLVYTGLTRAKKLAIVVGSNKAIGLAVRQNQVGKRYTRLPTRLGLPILAID
jgi:ATP-dependent exoDNAse (exonuclease V) alpha subunit